MRNGKYYAFNEQSPDSDHSSLFYNTEYFFSSFNCCQGPSNCIPVTDEAVYSVVVLHLHYGKCLNKCIYHKAKWLLAGRQVSVGVHGSSEV